LPLLFLSVLSVATQAAADVGSAPRAQRLTPRIVNGVVTSNYPTVGWVAQLDDLGNRIAGCSGTLIGCQTFLTAAHCLCPNGDQASCLLPGPLSPSNLSVFLQSGGFFSVASTAISPDFLDTGLLGDIAVVKLLDPVTGIPPTRINATAEPLRGSSGMIVGYGGVGGSPNPATGVGIKRAGKVVTSGCSSQIPGDFFLCSSFDLPIGPPGQDSDTCFGDSGGPLFIDFGSGDTVAAVTSGGADRTCSPPDLSWSTDVFRYHAFVENAAGPDLVRTSCGSIPQLGASSNGALYSFTIPPETTVLRVTLNGDLSGPSGPNNFDLYVRHGDQPTPSAFDCADTSLDSLGACTFDRPMPGTWYARVQEVAGAGAFQVTTTIFAGVRAPCSGDCNGDGQVTVDELLSMVNGALGNSAASTCMPGDTNHDDHITIDEVLAAVNKALNGCTG
jgi:hypothetical protein